MDRIPNSTDEINAEWIASAIQTRAVNQHLRSVELVESNSGTTGRAFYNLAWNEGSQEELPDSVFVKLPPTDPVQRQSNAEMGMGIREAKFYAELSDEIPVLHPRPFYSAWNSADSSYIMLLENISHSGGRPLLLGPDSEYLMAEQLVSSLAELHGKYWNSPRFDKDLKWLTPYVPIRNPEPPILVERCCRLFSDFMPPVFQQAAELFITRQHQIADLFEKGTPTLVHGDCHLSNLFVNREGKLGFYDWAIVSKMPAMWDVAYGLCISFPPDVRRKAEKKLFPLYLDQLREVCGTIDYHDMWLRYRVTAFFAWISAATTLGCGERMQPLEWGMNTIRWTTQALEDLEVLDLLKAELND